MRSYWNRFQVQFKTAFQDRNNFKTVTAHNLLSEKCTRFARKKKLLGIFYLLDSLIFNEHISHGTLNTCNKNHVYNNRPTREQGQGQRDISSNVAMLQELKNLA